MRDRSAPVLWHLPLLAGFHLLFAVMMVVSADSASSQLLRVGGVLNTKPWQFRDASNRVVGFEADLANQIGDRLGMRVEFVDLPPRDLFTAIDDQRIDIAMNAIAATDERARRFSLTQPYYDFSLGLVVMRKSGLRGLGDIARKSVGVQSPSASQTWLNANKARYGIAEVRRYASVDDALGGLVAHDVDGVFAELPVLFFTIRDKSDISVVTRVPTPDRFAAVLKRNSPLLTKVDAAITDLKNDGTLAQIHANWFGFVPDKSSSTIKVLPHP